MRNALTIFMFVMGLSALPLAAVAQEDPEETTEVVEGENASEEDLMLPEDAAEEGHTNSAFGLETANEARQSGREFGQAQAENARENGQDSGGEFIPENPGSQP